MTIDMRPGNDENPNTICFGNRFRGCDFPEKAVLSSKALVYRRVCGSSFASELSHVYSVSAPGKKQSLLVYQQSGGSGGLSSSLEIRPLSAQAEACKPVN
jgi:hypothetical protein